MSELEIAVSHSYPDCFSTHHTYVNIDKSNYIGVAAITLSVSDIERGKLDEISATGYDIPVFIAAENEEYISVGYLPCISGVFEHCESRKEFYGRQLETAASHYETQLRPPLFHALVDYVNQGNSAFDCPNHQGGGFFHRHLTSNQFVEYFGEMLLRPDLYNADVAMGDLPIHEGAPYIARQHTAKIFNTDKTYSALNSTSSSNRVVLNASLTPGDLVLFDRSNHKSNRHGALLQTGATPVYLETARNPYGLIGGIDAHRFEESYLRELITEVAPQRAKETRPFRLAVIQLGTYDGTIYNAHQVMDKIGHLCSYILFDSAWVGCEQFIPVMIDCSPLLLDLNKDGPGILITQSIYKQQAGFSQTSQIHKKDSHIKGQQHYVPHRRVNNAFMVHVPISPFCPLFAALDINAKIHEGVSGRNIWMDCVVNGINARKLILDNCQHIRPFVPELVDGRPWRSYETA